MAVTSSKRASRARFIVRPLFAALVASGIVAPVHGATILVATGSDAGGAGTCTLRQAVESMNAGAVQGSCINSGGAFGSSDLVTVPAGTITLGGTAVPIQVPMQISGAGPTATTISGNTVSRVFEIGNAGADVTITDLRAADGRSQGPGGCISLVDTSYSPPTFGTLFLTRAIVSGCIADNTSGEGPGLPGLGGGVFSYAVQATNSTVSGNTAQLAGGGIVAALVSLQNSVVTGNVVTGIVPAVESPKYIVGLGGGGILAGAAAYLAYSVVSDNVVHPMSYDFAGPDSQYTLRIGTGGGLMVVGKYDGEDPDPGMRVPTAKATIAGTRPVIFRATHAKAAQWRVAAAQRFTAGSTREKAMVRPAAIVLPQTLVLANSTVSGNRIVADPTPPNHPLIAKYAGGGAAFASQEIPSVIANSTISGNQLPRGTTACVDTETEPTSVKASCGAGIVGDSASISNSTITGNVGTTAVQLKYQVPLPTMMASAKVSAIKAAQPQLAAALQGFAESRAAKPRQKATSGPVFESAIVAGNSVTYDIGCAVDCTIGGSNNLIRSAASNVTLPGGTISAAPQLGPLADNGGAVAGAIGAPSTGVVRTHGLYDGSPAVDTGNNVGSYASDQRGLGFARTVGGNTDIGAFEGTIGPAPVVPNAKPVPALGPWMLGLLSALLGALGFWRRRRRA